MKDTEVTLPVDVVRYEAPRGAVDVRLGDPMDPKSFVAEFLTSGVVTLWANDLCHIVATFTDGEWEVEEHV